MLSAVLTASVDEGAVMANVKNQSGSHIMNIGYNQLRVKGFVEYKFHVTVESHSSRRLPFSNWSERDIFERLEFLYRS